MWIRERLDTTVLGSLEWHYGVFHVLPDQLSEQRGRWMYCSWCCHLSCDSVGQDCNLVSHFDSVLELILNLVKL